MPLPPAVQIFSVDAAAFLAGIDEMLSATDRLAASIDAVAASAERMSASLAAASAKADESLTAAAGAADESAAAADRATTAQVTLSDAEKAAADAAQFEAGLLADLEASQTLLAASAKAVTDGLAAEAKAMGLVADEAALAGDATAVAGEKSVVAGDEAASAGDKAATAGGMWKTALLGIGIALAYGVDKAAGFQTQVTRLYTAAGLTGASMAQVSQQILKVGDATGFTGTQIAEALYHPVSAGLNLQTALAAVTQGAQLAQIHGASLDDTMYALSSVMKAFNQNAGDAGNTAALLNSIVGQGDMRFQDFNQSVKNWAPTGASMGISIQSMGAALAYLTDRGNTAEVASTRLTMGLSMVTSGSKEANTFLKSLGLTSGSVALQNKSLADVMNSYGLTTNKIASDLKQPDGIYVALTDLQGAFKHSGLSAEQADQVMAKLFGGGRSDKAILTLMSNLDGLKQKYQSIGKGVSDYGNSWAKTQQTVAFQWKQTVGDAQNLAITFGSVLLPAADRLMKGLSAVMAVMQQHPAIALFAGGLLALAAGFKIAATMEAVFAAVTESGAAPVFLVIAAVAALVLGLYELYEHSKLVRDIVADVGKFFKAAWSDAMKGADAVIKWFTSGPLAFIKQQLAVFDQFWAEHGAQIEQIARAVWGAVSAIITTYWRIIWDGEIKPGLVILQAVWKVAWGLISDTVRLVWDTVAATIRAAVRIVLDIISLALDLITGKWGAAWNDCKKLVSDTFHGITNIFSTFASGAVKLLWDAGVNIVNGLINGIKSMVGAVGSAISSVASGAVSAFKSALSIFSPSKVFYELGAYITQGLANGISETAAQAEAAANSLAAKVNTAYARGQITAAEQTQLLGQIDQHIASRSDTLGKTMQRLGLEMGRQLITGIADATSASTAKTAVDKLNTYIEQAWSVGDVSFNRASDLLTWVQDENGKLQSLAAQRQSIVATMKAADTYAANVTSSTESWASLSNAQTESGGTSGADIGAGMQMQLAQIKEFANDIKTLGKRGLSKTLLDQIIQAGPATGLPIAESLMDDTGNQIQSLNSAQSAISYYSQSLGSTAADAMYDSGSQAGKGFLSGLTAQEHAITAEMDKIANSMVSTLKEDLKISSPSRVMHDAGSDTAAGLVQGLVGGRGGVQQAAHGLAQAITAGVNGGTSLAGLRVTGAAGGGTAGGNTVFAPQFTINGYIGNEQELAQHLFELMQHAALQSNRRNPTNGLSLIS